MTSMHSNDQFENPYNFVPSPPRKTDHSRLGDGKPAGHDRYQPELYSGRIEVELKTVTPLLIPDAGRSHSAEHRAYGVRKDAAGHPYLPPTSLRGALRSAYEAITNSRFGVFEKHDQPLALRMAANEALGLVPCRVFLAKTPGDADAEPVWVAKPLTGSEKISSGGKPGRNVMYAAWLPRYRRGANSRSRGEPEAALTYRDNSLPAHKDRVFVQTEETLHRSKKFSYLKVTAIQKAEKNSQPAPAGWQAGWVFVTGANIKNKHDEKVFLDPPPSVKPVPISDQVVRNWETLIADYQAIHEKEIAERLARRNGPADYLGDDPGQTAFSIQARPGFPKKLTTGTLCYARVKTRLKPGRGAAEHEIEEILALYPVAISRMLYKHAPLDLVDPGHLPATALERLSPADRVFGWVNQKGHGAYKGQLRIGAVSCVEGAAAIETVGGEAGVPLSILGQPKPAQSRFYLAKDKQGTPFKQGVGKGETYLAEQGLRGRKVYPHQQQTTLPGYWTANGQATQPINDRINNRAIYREWRRCDGARDSQNRSIREWVRPGSTFRFAIDVNNLSAKELGGLLWLLNLPENHYLRVGGGKPLGFGSTRWRISGLSLANGKALKARYQGFDPKPVAAADGQVSDITQAEPLISQWQAATAESAGAQNFSTVPFIQAFLNAAKGGELPVHYPRVSQEPVMESYQWFVANDASNNNRKEQYALPALSSNSRGLWILNR